MINLDNISIEELKTLKEELLNKYDKLLIEAEKLAFSLKETRETLENIDKKINA